jgi:hypothetical protein
MMIIITIIITIITKTIIVITKMMTLLIITMITKIMRTTTIKIMKRIIKTSPYIITPCILLPGYAAWSMHMRKAREAICAGALSSGNCDTMRWYRL